MAKKKDPMSTTAANTVTNGQFEIPGFLLSTTPDPAAPSKANPTTEIIKKDPPKASAPDQTDNAEPAAPSLTSLPREELLEYIFRSTCNPEWRRWERELYFGATDEELAVSMGHSYHSGGELNLAFRTDTEPALTVTYRVFDVPVATASGAECAAYIRRIVGIPQRVSPEEHSKLLTKKLEELRVECRQQLMSYIRSLTGEKFQATRKKKKSKTDDNDGEPSISEEITAMLCEDDCLTETSDRRLLIKITQLLHRRANVEILKAAENAVNLIKRAKGEWKSATYYWTEDDKKPSQSAYQPGKEVKASEPAPPE